MQDPVINVNKVLTANTAQNVATNVAENATTTIGGNIFKVVTNFISNLFKNIFSSITSMISNRNSGFLNPITAIFNKIKGIRKQITDKRNKISTLKNKITQLQSQPTATTTSTANKSASSTTSVSEQIAELNTQIASLENEVKQLQETISELEFQLEIKHGYNSLYSSIMFIPVKSVKNPESNLDLNKINKGFVNIIQGMPFTSDIEHLTECDKDSVNSIGHNIKLMSELNGAKQFTDVFNSVKLALFNINNFCSYKENSSDYMVLKTASEVRNWCHILRHYHSTMDRHLKNEWEKYQLFHYCKDYSQQMGLNTLLNYADTTNLDITDWGRESSLLNNEIEKYTDTWKRCNYIRDNIRNKLPNNMSKFIQTSNNVTTGKIIYNLPIEWKQSTASGNGALYIVERPISPEKAHGVNLNNDWYHWKYRIEPLKNQILKDVFTYLNNYYNKGDFLVHSLVQHLQSVYEDVNVKNPLLYTTQVVQNHTPIGCEETFKDINEKKIVWGNMKNEKVYFVNDILIDNSSIDVIPRQESE